MILQAYSVYDNKSLQYHPPFFASTDGAAVRMLADLANDTNTNIGRHPTDYSLFNVGTYSDSNGSLEPSTPLRHVIDAASLLTIKPTGDLFRNSAEATVAEFNRKATK